MQDIIAWAAGVLVGAIVSVPFIIIDIGLYHRAAEKRGAQWKLWPGSGLYLWWKYRKS